MKHNSIKWNKQLAVNLHVYTRVMWQKQNIISHRESDGEKVDVMKQKCRCRIRELYKNHIKNCSWRTTQSKKGMVAGMSLWIERVEMISQQKDQDKENYFNTKIGSFLQTKKWYKKVTTIV